MNDLSKEIDQVDFLNDENLNTLQLTIEGLESIKQELYEQEGVNRSMMASLETLCPDAIDENYPVSSYTLRVSHTNYDIAQEAVVKATANIVKNISGSIFQYLLNGIRWLNELVKKILGISERVHSGSTSIKSVLDKSKKSSNITKKEFLESNPYFIKEEIKGPRSRVQVYYATHYGIFYYYFDDLYTKKGHKEILKIYNDLLSTDYLEEHQEAVMKGNMKNNVLNQKINHHQKKLRVQLYKALKDSWKDKGILKIIESNNKGGELDIKKAFTELKKVIAQQKKSKEAVAEFDDYIKESLKAYKEHEIDDIVFDKDLLKKIEKEQKAVEEKLEESKKLEQKDKDEIREKITKKHIDDKNEREDLSKSTNMIIKEGYIVHMSYIVAVSQYIAICDQSILKQNAALEKLAADFKKSGIQVKKDPSSHTNKETV